MVTELLRTAYVIMMMVSRLLAFCSFVVLLTAHLPQARAQYQSFEGKVVKSIQFDPVEQPLEAGELHDILPLKIGAPLSMATVRESIDRLFRSGRYADIQVEAQPYQDGVVIRFLTKNSWFIGDVTVHGNISSPPNIGQLENATHLELGQPYTEPQVADAQASQQRIMEVNGLFRSSVRPRFDF